MQVAIGVALGTGWPWQQEPRTPGRVLYLAAEEHVDTLIDRLRAIAYATSMLTEDMERLDATLDVCSMIDLPEATLSAFGDAGPLTAALRAVPFGRYRLIVIDPVASFAGVDAENDNAATTRVVKYLRAVGKATGAAIVVIHHVGKAAILAGQTHLAISARGAVALTDGVRWQAQLTRLPDDQAELVAEPTTWRLLVVAKANHVKDGETAWLRFGPDGVLWSAPQPSASSVKTSARRGQGW